MRKEYFNSRAAIWDETVAEKNMTKLQSLASRLEIKPGSVVLDVGTGTGVFVPLLLDRIGSQGKLVCLDYAAEMLSHARAKYPVANIEFFCADIIQSQLTGESFDVIVCYSSFPHFEDKPAALIEIYRLLKNRGRLFICHSSSRVAINAVHSQIPEVSTDLIPDAPEMTQVLHRAGFSEIDIYDEAEFYLASAKKR